jgi:chromosome segregation ATPase
MMGAIVAGEDTRLALLRIVSDPEKHQAALDALTKRINEANSAEAAAKAAQDNLQADKAEIEAERAKADKELSRREAEMNSAIDASVRAADERAQGLLREKQDHERAVATHALRQQELANQATALQQRARDLDARDDALNEKSAALDARDKAAAQALREAQEAKIAAQLLRDQHEAKLQKVNRTLQSLNAAD